MYCPACGASVTSGLSYCNRCGASLRERSDTKSNVPAFLTAITLIGIGGLGIMLGGALALRRDADMAPEIVGFFMFFTFIIVVVTEVLLVRQLSRLTEKVQPAVATPSQNSVSSADPRSLAAGNPGDSISSVTENTTRTLEYSRNQR